MSEHIDNPLSGIAAEMMQPVITFMCKVCGQVFDDTNSLLVSYINAHVNDHVVSYERLKRIFESILPDEKREE